MITDTTEKLYTFAEAAKFLGLPQRRVLLFVKRNLVEVTDSDKISESALLDLENRRKLGAEEFARIMANQEQLRQNVLAELEAAIEETDFRNP